MSREDLADRPLAELHSLAGELGIKGYRMLRRDELVDELVKQGGEEVEAKQPDREPERPRRRRRRRGRRRKDESDERDDAESDGEAEQEGEPPRESAPTEPATGVLDVTPQRYGFLRLTGLEPAEGDVYVSASQIRRVELRPGDEVSGPAREPRGSERHRALVHVDGVNGIEPGPEGIERTEFESLTPVAPSRRIELDLDAGDVLTRAVDLFAPLAFGQRVLVTAAPRSGRTTLLRSLAKAIGSASDEPAVIVLLVDERPVEATAWHDALDGVELATATADMGPRDQRRVAELALERAKRRAEAGEDVVLIVDSLSRLAAAYRDPADVKHVFGAGRELSEEGSGSLAVIATALEGEDEDEDDGALAAVETTENALIALDAELAAAGVVPALRVDECRVSGEEEIRTDDELAAVRKLRDELSDRDPREAAEELRERIEGSKSNQELLRDA